MAGNEGDRRARRSILVFGQMNDAPGSRFRVALTALTMAEYFRDVQHSEVMFLVDNVFRYVQAGSEVSGLLGRLPSEVGYQPTLADDLAAVEERITSVERRGHHLRAGRLRSGGRPDRPRRRPDLRPPRFQHRPFPRPGRPGALSGHRPAGLDFAAARSRPAGRAALPAGPPREGNHRALPRVAGHHRHARHGGTVGGGPADRCDGPAGWSAS